jgi:thiosulfate reductase cytochrome b subunit
VNAFIVILLAITSLQLRVPDIALFGAYKSGVLIHKYAGYAMAASFMFWLGYSLLSGNVRYNYVFRQKDLAGVFPQARFYLLGIFKGEANPFVPAAKAKFNGLQKIAYMSTMFVFTPLIIMTGIVLSDIFYFRPLIYSIFWGPRMVDAIHVAVVYVFLIYMLIHMYMAIFLGTRLSHVKAMIFGYEEEPVPENPEKA